MKQQYSNAVNDDVVADLIHGPECNVNAEWNVTEYIHEPNRISDRILIAFNRIALAFNRI
jgi:hypothetical protein